jgi:hypothetical protein
MGSVALLVILVGVFIVYEAVKSLTPAEAAASANQPASSAGTGGGTAVGNAVQPVTGSGGSIPQNWLQALAAHESPSALRGDFTYGAFGLSAGSTPGIGVPGTTAYSSQDPRGGTFTPQLFNSWDQAVQGLRSWIDRYAPEAYGASSCAQFMSILQSHGYGPLAGTC